MRVNGTPAKKSSETVAPGDILSFPQGNGVRVVRVLGIGARRGPADEARLLYAEITERPGA